MIESLSIRNIGVISSAELELGPGFIALTGETGAGKTMVLTGLGLLFGDRADSSSVRAGESQLQVQGRIRSESPDLLARLEELGASVEDGEILINRSVSTEGKSRAAIGGAAVPISILSEISEQLVAVHGQSEQIRLRSQTKQREALDQFGGATVANALAAYSAGFTQYRDLKARLERMQLASEQDATRVMVLREQIAELEKAQLESGELAEIEERINRLSNVEELRIAASSAHDLLVAEEGDAAVAMIGRARKVLEGASDAALNRLAQLASDASAIAAELATELSVFLSDLEADPAELERLLNRRAILVGLERRFGLGSDDLVELLPKLHAELLDLDASDEQLEKLEMQLAAAESQLAMAAAELTKSRRQAATELSARVSAELSALAMPGSSLVIEISELSNFESHGLDRIEFLLASHPGAEPRPIGKGASGGELSRIMLAIELSLSADSDLPTMIFDEVDAGVGGAAAVELGKRLKQLSKTTQVIVVTHLPQVAAFADHQINVSKDQSGEITLSSVRLLGEGERARELARMLSGNPESELALMHAKELLESAK